MSEKTGRRGSSINFILQLMIVVKFEEIKIDYFFCFYNWAVNNKLQPHNIHFIQNSDVIY